MPRARPILAALSVLTAVSTVGALSARAQVTIPPVVPPPPPGGGSPPPPKPPAAPAPAPKAPGPAQPGQPTGGDTVEKPGPRTIPPDAQRIINSVRRTGGNSTARLIEALRPLRAMGLSEEEVIRIGFGRFPVGGPANYTDDWLAPRFTPTFHLHQGNDIFADFGTPVRSPADGVYTQSNGAVGGLAAYVREGNGTTYYMAHLQGFPKGVRSGQRVKVGDIVGYNGDSGNAKGGPPHVHLQVHPGGGGPVNPKPHLDRWLREALANVPKIIASLEAGRPRAVVATGLTRRLPDGGDGIFGAPPGPPRSHLLWASSANPSGGPLHLAEAEATAAAAQVNWTELARQAQARAEAQRLADLQARLLLAPLTPRLLHPSLGIPESFARGP